MPRNALTLEQQREFHSQILRGVPTDLDIEVFDYWRAHGAELNAVLRDALGRIPQTVSVLLKLVATVSLPAIAAFSAEDHFQVGESEGVKIGWLGDNFKRVFASKVEQNVAEATLKIHQLLKGSLDAPIIAELGGEEKVVITLGQMFHFLKLQGHPNTGIRFIFYIHDQEEDVLWAVSCRWDSYYADWGVSADPITGPHGWDAGYRIVSR